MKKALIRVIAKTGSTNELAMEALSKGAPQGTSFLADAQLSGRGRRGTAGIHKPWHSPGGKNIYLSVVIRPDVEPERLAPITLAVGAALVEVLRERTGVDLWLKWPNDLYVGERKLGGVLTEGMVGARGVEGAVVGVGLNVNLEADELPDELQSVATSLKIEAGGVQDRLSLILALVDAIVLASKEYAAGGLEVFQERLERWDRLKGRVVEVDLGGGSRRGRADGISERGGLMVRFDGGERQEILGGAVYAHGLGGVVLDGEE